MILSRRRLIARTAKFVAQLAALVAVTLPLAGYVSIEALFAPKAEPWPRWQAPDPASEATVDHAAWGRLLESYLRPGPLSDEDGVNHFDYAAVTIADRAALGRYITDLAALRIDDYSRSEQFAYWVNLYNALTVHVVLSHYPVASIRDIDVSPGLFSDGPWDRPLVIVAGEALTLNDIEHRILRPIWQDPRIHYAVNCASVGCPNLQAVPFTAENAEELLESAARAYVNSPRGLQFVENGLVVSSIYVWFQEDFGDSDADVIAHLERYAEPALADRIRQTPRLSGHTYDWALNDARRAGS
jgi:hypothetical protein